MPEAAGWIALSVSDPPQGDLTSRGLSSEHLDLAFIELSRHLLAAGYNLAYGGNLDLRGFTDQLFDLVRSYRLPGTRSADSDKAVSRRVRNYLAAPIHDGSTAEQLAAARNVADVRRVEPPEPLKLPSSLADDSRVTMALSLSEMRERITAETSARIVIGGRLAGAAGRSPGVLEEAWSSVRAGKPLFVLGGFGGVAVLVAGVLLGRSVEDRMSAIDRDEGYRSLALQLKDVLPENVLLGARLMLAEIGEGGIEGLRNGLGREDNARLFDTDDMDEAIDLILHGLAST